MNVQTVDKTGIKGSDTFPINVSDYYKAVETLAYQGIEAVKSSNPIENAFYDYPVDGNGRVIEEAIIEMAKAKAFVPTAEGQQPDLSPLDPKLHVKYFNNYEKKQYKVTVRDEELDKVLLKGMSPEAFATKIVDTLTQGEAFEDFKTEASFFAKANFVDAKTAIGGAPLNMKGVLYAIREMASVIHATNKEGGVPCEMSVDLADIRIAIPSDVKSLIDYTELANTFNMSVEEMKGHIVELPVHGAVTWPDSGTCVYVYDVHRLGRAIKKRKFVSDTISLQEYRNMGLNVDKGYLVNELAKGLYLDISNAITAAKGTIIGNAGQ